MLAFARGADWDASDFKTLTGASVAGIGLIALTSGAIIYSIYRALIYVYTSRIAGCLSSMTTSWNERKISYWLPTHVPSAEFDEDIWRWTFGAENGKQDEAARGRLSEWGSQVHLCYTIALAIGMGSFFGVLAIGKCPSPDRFLILIAVFFLSPASFLTFASRALNPVSANQNHQNRVPVTDLIKLSSFKASSGQGRKPLPAAGCRSPGWGMPEDS